MFQALDPDAYHRVLPLCAALDCHLAPRAIAARAAEGCVFVDDPARPTVALVCNAHRYYLTGRPDDDAFREGLRRFFLEDVYPRAQAAGAPVMFVVHYDYAPGWEEVVPTILAGKHPLAERRRYLEWSEPVADRDTPLPEGYRLRAVDADLLAEEGLANLDALREEMCSERDSVDEFLSRSFGYCAIHGEEIAAWCLSEYNVGDRCEVGIETVPAHRRRGLGTAVASALLEEAAARGIRRVGWHAWAENAASIATARRAGFGGETEYAVYYAWFDEAANLAVNGNVRLRAGDYAGAAEWFGRALGGERPAPWIRFCAACAYARVGRADEALAALRDAVAGGWRDAEAIRRSPHLEALHGTAGWRDLLAGLEGGA